jgi:hypothetical protein
MIHMGKSLSTITNYDASGLVGLTDDGAWFVDVDDDGTAFTWFAGLDGAGALPDDEIQHVRDFHAGKLCDTPPCNVTAYEPPGGHCGRTRRCHCHHELAGNW